jgi:DNA-binding NtrC family response regulator
MVDAHTIELTGLAPAGIAGGRWILRVESGPRAGEEIRLTPKPVTVGAGGDCGFVLEDPAVSRVHAEVSLGSRGVLVKDHGSTNGTFVGATRVDQAELPVGGVVRIGDTKLRVVRGDAPRLPPSERTRFGELAGASPAMREVFAILELAARADVPVLLEGPSGTGKELSARALHDHSARAPKPFVVFDCGSTSPDLLQSALMGHKKGAFTGANQDREGAFVAAHEGTLFLDEIGELPLDAQTHLLRALESRTVTPVGADKSRAVDARVVAATNRDLARMVEQGTFRLDLFHRLAVVQIRLPALADRLEDLPVLIERFYESKGVDPGPIAGKNLESLRAHEFEGNVRELRNVLERSWVLSGGSARFDELLLWLGPSSSRETGPVAVDIDLPFKEAKEQATDAFEAAYLPALMTRFEGNLTQAAKHSGLSRRHLRALLVKHGLRGGE